VQACHDCYTLEFSLEKTCDVIGSVHPVRKCSKRTKVDQSQSRFGTVQVSSKIAVHYRHHHLRLPTKNLYEFVYAQGVYVQGVPKVRSSYFTRHNL